MTSHRIQLARQWDREAASRVTDVMAAIAASARAAVVERNRVQAALDAAAHCDIASIVPGDLVRDRHAWHRVVKVNAKSVTVVGIYGRPIVERIAKDRIIETRHVEAVVDATPAHGIARPVAS